MEVSHKSFLRKSLLTGAAACGMLSLPAAKLVECGKCFEPWQTRGLIDHPEIKVKSDEVAEPVAVRYMGQDRSTGSLYNQVSLPLGAFEFRNSTK